MRLLKAAIPIAIVILLLSLLGRSSFADPSTTIGIFVVCALILWFGWDWVKQNSLMKWSGIILAVILGVVLGLVAVGLSLRIGLIALVLLLLAMPFLIYDLFFRQPHKGRFSRARAERKNAQLN